MSVMLCTAAAAFARIVSFDTTGLHLLTFSILELHPSKDTELDLSHVISR